MMPKVVEVVRLSRAFSSAYTDQSFLAGQGSKIPQETVGVLAMLAEFFSSNFTFLLASGSNYTSLRGSH